MALFIHLVHVPQYNKRPFITAFLQKTVNQKTVNQNISNGLNRTKAVTSNNNNSDNWFYFPISPEGGIGLYQCRQYKRDSAQLMHL